MKINSAYLLMCMPAPSEVFLSLEVKALIAAGINVEVFCLRKFNKKHKELIELHDMSGVSIFMFPYILSLSVWRDVGFWMKKNPRVLWDIIALISRACWFRPELWIKSLIVVPKSFSIARRIHQEKVQVVHAAWGHYPAITGYLVKLLIPSVHFTIGLGAYDRIAKHPLTSIAANVADCILTQGNTSKKILKTQWPKPACPIQVIRRGIDIECLREVKKNTTKIPYLIVSAGNLKKNKGHQHVIKAFSKVLIDFPKARLRIIGEGHYRKNLEKLVVHFNLEDYVTFAGHLKQKELFCHIAQAGAFVLASETENLPNIVKEAMALGTPVVTTPTTGINELVLEGITGCIVGKGNENEIFECIRKIFNDQPFSHYITQHAFKHVERHFDLQDTTQQRVHLFKSMFLDPKLQGVGN